MSACLSASAAGGGLRAGTSGPDRSGVGKEAYAAALQVLAQTRHEPDTTEGSLLLY